jgi:hypothetical protein
MAAGTPLWAIGNSIKYYTFTAVIGRIWCAGMGRYKPVVPNLKPRTKSGARGVRSRVRSGSYGELDNYERNKIFYLNSNRIIKKM